MNERVNELLRPLRDLGFNVGWRIERREGRDVWQADLFKGRNFRLTVWGDTLEEALEALHAELINRARKALEDLKPAPPDD